MQTSPAALWIHTIDTIQPCGPLSPPPDSGLAEIPVD